MSWEVFLWVVAGVDGAEAQYRAQRFLATMPEATSPWDTSVRVRKLIADVASGKAIFSAEKGSILLWGGVFNYGDGQEFIDVAMPFFKDLWEERGSNVAEGLNQAIFSFENVLVFSEDEQNAKRMVWEIHSDCSITLRQGRNDNGSEVMKPFWLWAE